MQLEAAFREERALSHDARVMPWKLITCGMPSRTVGSRSSSAVTRLKPAVESSCVLLFLTLVLAAGCRHTSTTSGSPPLFPLDEGMTWTFTLEDPRGPVTNVISRVERVEGREVHLVSGATAYTYEVRDDGIYRPSVGAYLLKEPLTTGATWEGEGGLAVSVIATGQEVEVPAGSFQGCLSIEETMGSEGASQIHTFCPGVGPVRIEQFIDGEMYARGELTGYGPATEVEGWE